MKLERKRCESMQPDNSEGAYRGVIGSAAGRGAHHPDLLAYCLAAVSGLTPACFFA